MRFINILSAVVVAGVAGCMTEGGHAGPVASATLEARSGSTVTGSVTFKQAGDHVRAHVEISGLAPNSEHGFHVHEKGDCSAADGASAGGHFNPAAVAHGRAGGAVHHAGDLPSLVADANGKVRADLDLAGVTLDAGPNSIVGRSAVAHRDADDFTSQPSGNSGPRVACGVIRAK